MTTKSFRAIILAGASLFAGCQAFPAMSPPPVERSSPEPKTRSQIKPDLTPLQKVNTAAIEQTTYTTSYDPAYAKLDYPNGDVPKETGVCADVMVRAFRSGGIDLQKELHEEMTANFKRYPQLWNARRPDKNIDHRRVANLMSWFNRQGKSLPVTKDAGDYSPGDVVARQLDSGLLHIGIVSNKKIEGAERYGVVHNISNGARLEDVLLAWKIIGRYRYF